MRLLTKGLFAAGVLGITLGAPGVALACKAEPNAVFSDDFKDDSGGWDLSGGNLKFGGDGLSATMPKGGVATLLLNLTFSARSGTMCTTYAVPTVKDPLPSQGIVFWATDSRNFYMVQTDINRKAYIYRRADGAWIKLYDAEVPGMKVEPGDTNEMAITIKDTTITVSINGAEIRHFRAQPPDGAMRFGLYMQSASPVTVDGGVAFQFKDFVVNPAG